jgi:hypothetical protein
MPLAAPPPPLFVDGQPLLPLPPLLLPGLLSASQMSGCGCW